MEVLGFKGQSVMFEVRSLRFHGFMFELQVVSRFVVLEVIGFGV